jgi:hypothetical protein
MQRSGAFFCLLPSCHCRFVALNKYSLAHSNPLTHDIFDSFD